MLGSFVPWLEIIEATQVDMIVNEVCQSRVQYKGGMGVI